MDIHNAALTDPFSAALTSRTEHSINWHAIAIAWLVEVSKRSGSTRTPTEYGRYLGRFLTSNLDPLLVTPAHVHAFAYGSGSSGREPGASAVIVRLAALRGFFDFARRMGLLANNPAKDVKTPRLNEPVPKGLSADQIRKLISVIPDTVSGSRDRAIIITCVLTGLRRAEVMALRAGDITVDPETGQAVYQVRAKGGYQRHRDLPAPALLAIEESIKRRGDDLANLASDVALFHISAVGFYGNLKRYAAKAGLIGVTLHVLRHSAAKLRRQTGASIEDVGSLLGHRSLYTTARYLARLEGQRDEGWRGVAGLIGIVG
jgi:site-specific recombinase XerD